MTAISSSETSVLTRTTRRNIPENAILQLNPVNASSHSARLPSSVVSIRRNAWLQGRTIGNVQTAWMHIMELQKRFISYTTSRRLMLHCTCSCTIVVITTTWRWVGSLKLRPLCSMENCTGTHLLEAGCTLEPGWAVWRRELCVLLKAKWYKWIVLHYMRSWKLSDISELCFTMCALESYVI
jgi:hypothetical protein